MFIEAMPDVSEGFQKTIARLACLWMLGDLFKVTPKIVTKSDIETSTNNIDARDNGYGTLVFLRPEVNSIKFTCI